MKLAFVVALMFNSCSSSSK